MPTLDLLLKDEVYAMIGAAMAVHNEMGNGFGEAVYQECMQIELGLRAIESLPQAELQIYYKGQLLEKKYVADFLCFGSVVVEIKALSELSGTEEAQILNYLKATGFRVGAFVDFVSKAASTGTATCYENRILPSSGPRVNITRASSSSLFRICVHSCPLVDKKYFL